MMEVSPFVVGHSMERTKVGVVKLGLVITKHDRVQVTSHIHRRRQPMQLSPKIALIQYS
jgi:hypothetical protein